MTPAKTDHDALVRTAETLSALSDTTTSLIAVFSRKDWDPDEVATVASRDAVIVAKLLRLANSPWAGAREEVGTVDKAIVRVGSGAVLTLAMASAMSDIMSRPIPEYLLDEGALWRRSVAASVFVDVASESRIRSPLGTSTAALLHPIGKLLLTHHIGDRLQPLHDIRLESESLHETELEVLGVSHAEAGGLVARAWHLPELLCLGVQYYVAPTTAPTEDSQQISHIVRLAYEAAQAIDGNPAFLATGGPLESLNAIGVSDQRFEEMIDETRRRLEIAMACYS